MHGTIIYFSKSRIGGCSLQKRMSSPAQFCAQVPVHWIQAVLLGIWEKKADTVMTSDMSVAIRFVADARRPPRCPASESHECGKLFRRPCLGVLWLSFLSNVFVLFGRAPSSHTCHTRFKAIGLPLLKRVQEKKRATNARTETTFAGQSIKSLMARVSW